MKKENNVILTQEQKALYTSINALQSTMASGTLTASEMVYQQEMTKKQKDKLVSEIYFKNKKRKEFYICNDGRVKSYNPQFIANTREELIDKLYNYFFGYTLEGMYKKWVLHRHKLKTVSGKTLEEDVGIWNRNLHQTDLANMQVANIEPRDLLHLFETWTGDGIITRKAFNDRTRVLNGIFKYSVLEGVIKTNPLRDLPYGTLKFKCPIPKNKVYSLEERNALLNYLETLEADAYTLAIQLCFYSILRIGEIKALSWSSENLNQITINTQLVPEREMNEDLTFNQRTFVERAPKGNPYFSIRTETINPKGVQILYQMKQLNPHGKYLFMYHGRPLTTDTFNRRLRKYCNEIGITYHSSHGIRFTSASICHANGMPDTEIQPLLGHSTLRMTQHYLRSVSESPNGSKMQDFLC